MGTLNLGTVKTPGVYIDEMSLFPPSVAQVETAVPAFIGPTEISGPDVWRTPTRISSMAEYRSIFGGAPSRQVTVTVDGNNAVTSVVQGSDPVAAVPYLHDSLLLFFGNGGNKCYIVSTGDYLAGIPGTAAYQECLDALKKVDEPTIIVAPDAVRSSDVSTIQQFMLKHCRAMQDRFAILDVPCTTTEKQVGSYVGNFRTAIGSEALDYGAAYFPYLQTSIPLSLTYYSLTISRSGTTLDITDLVPGTTSGGQAASDMAKVKSSVTAINTIINGLSTAGGYAGASSLTAKRTYLLNSLAAFHNGNGDNFPPATSTTFTDNSLRTSYGAYVRGAGALYAALYNAVNTTDPATVTLPTLDALYVRLVSYLTGFGTIAQQRLNNAEVELRSKAPVYASIAAAAETQAIVLPPSGAIAGVYARTDAERGVWKSPANASLTYVTAPKVAIIDTDQDSMNVDPDGKSVNAIRAFSGKGTLVWGARTLAGNSAEWRYISVRRFFIMAEESIKNATAQFVFEANDANTWVRLRTMIENFLTLQWRAGALAGAKAEQAFFVRVGLGQTMTPQDVLDGFMIIEIGMAVVRPAEFIVLRFSHKMQQA